MRSDQASASFLSELKSYKFDDSGYDSNDQNFESNAAYQLELGSVSGKAGYMRGSTLGTEFLDTGRIGGVATRVERATAGGGGAYILTDKSRASVTLSYGQTDYASPRYIGGDGYYRRFCRGPISGLNEPRYRCEATFRATKTMPIDRQHQTSLARRRVSNPYFRKTWMWPSPAAYRM